MKNKKHSLLISMIFTLIVYISIIIISRPKNDITSIEKIISKQIKTNKTIIAYNSNVSDNHELVSYIIKDEQGYQKVGYAYFNINRNGNYELINVIDADKTTKKANDITIYEFSQLKVGNTTLPTQLIIISNNTDLAKIERITENAEIQVKDVINNPSINFF